MNHGTVSQRFPLVHDWPNPLGQRYHPVSLGQRAPLVTFRDTVSDRTLSPMRGVHVLIRHQTTNIEYHSHAGCSFQGARDYCRNMRSRVNQFNAISLKQTSREADSGYHIKTSGR
jgi:hypothetical protein